MATYSTEAGPAWSPMISAGVEMQVWLQFRNGGGEFCIGPSTPTAAAPGVLMDVLDQIELKVSIGETLFVKSDGGGLAVAVDVIDTGGAVLFGAVNHETADASQYYPTLLI